MIYYMVIILKKNNDFLINDEINKVMFIDD